MLNRVLNRGDLDYCAAQQEPTHGVLSLWENFMRIAKLIAVASALAMGASAQAATFVFTSSLYTYDFSLPDSPVTTVAVPDLGFIAPVASGNFNGAPTSFPAMTFLNAAYPGAGAGISYDSSFTNFFFGTVQMYSGSEATPTFINGVYSLELYGNPNVTGTLTITGVGGAVPEAATWAMMIGGLGLVGASMRRRVSKVSFA